MASAVPTVVEPISEPSTIRARDMSSVDFDESGDISLSSPDSKRGHHRRRSSSFVVVKHVRETPDQLVDQNIAPNANAEWVNMKGAWVIHVLLIAVAKLIINEVPGISDSVRWTLVNVGYMTQIDHGYQYTPSKKYLTSLPIGLFLLSTHYSHYNPWLFWLNLSALLFVLFPKLPILHRSRLYFFPGPNVTGTNTPAEPAQFDEK
ncbi:hypothetical protein MPSI1_000085 [Malassezia psittaci]|uniref:Orm1 type endoplasmic reticulum protein n=1 Tax=Malassezia psittaci TaxID=1821823 RepID=A0AAF0JCC9_9BASI|nr:hypothetical protein MPSI1_000085 [Malassezia psittaci]